MTSVALAGVLKRLGTSSVKTMCLSTGSSEKSVFRQAQIASIDLLYKMNRGFRGPFGFPLNKVEFNGQTATRKYAGGSIKYTNDSPQGGDVITIVRVRFVGFLCKEESDEWSGSDEPYFIIGVAGASGSNTVRMGPYKDVDAGEKFYEAVDVAGEAHQITPPVVLGVVAMEKDQGDAQEAEDKVRKVIAEIEKKFDQAAGILTGGSTGNHVLPEWSRDILLGWLPEGFSALFGMGDDEVGKYPVVLFDNSADLEEWRAPKVIGKHGKNEYNLVIPVDGGNEGSYDLYFLVDLLEDPKPKIKKRLGDI